MASSQQDSRPPEAAAPATQHAFQIEALKIGLKLLWFVLAVTALLVFRDPISDALRSGGISRVSIGILQVDLTKAKEQLATAEAQRFPADKFRPRVPEAFDALRNRICRNAAQVSGATVLWVDDNPHQNRYERRAFEALGVHVTSTRNTQAALIKLEEQDFDLLISDLDRPTDSPGACSAGGSLKLAGCSLASLAEDAARKGRIKKPPLVFYVGRLTPEYGPPAFSNGVTNRPDELLAMALDAFERRQVASDGRGCADDPEKKQ